MLYLVWYTADATELGDIEVCSERAVQPHHLWVGRSEVLSLDEGARSDG